MSTSPKIPHLARLSFRLERTIQNSSFEKNFKRASLKIGDTSQHVALTMVLALVSIH